MARQRTIQALAVAVVLIAATAGAQESVLGKTGFLAIGATLRPGMRDPLREPVVRGILSTDVLRTLRHGYVLAVERVTRSRGCSAAFAGLKIDGLTALANTRYRAASAWDEASQCQDAAALTRVGSPDVRLCLGFRTLTVESAAMILIHEALHLAGLSEWPVDPNAPRAGDINRALHASCEI
jgi:hypothetical protein